MGIVRTYLLELHGNLERERVAGRERERERGIVGMKMASSLLLSYKWVLKKRVILVQL